MTARPDWIAIDWGTTNLRIWAMSGDTVLDRRESTDGMGTLARDQFEPALLRLAGDWTESADLAVACGMVGSRQGWVEAPYVSVPCTPGQATPVIAPMTTDGLTVHVIPGISQTTPADVMRGEETQIAGYLALNPDFDGVICLPGTHTKWAHVSAGELVSFQTFMTGDLFSAIGGHTVLRHSVQSDDWDSAAFDAGLTAGMERPERIAARLFSLRAEGLLTGLPAAAARAHLSGLLIGAELIAARPYWLGQNVAIVGDGQLGALYQNALSRQGVSASQTSVENVTLAGLIRMYRTLKGSAA
ncbi:2-dehydro-3-deoxygalactonokinase [Loktanella sp. IMCC34160]|uniref:2-dehydro-3-deoxygalactonokinase n=1 Tax=Loktanella sp. IMCC34160 TaxID=2510646 RepID=UPI00101BD4E7|nr:2-dehydro-3-deoxygalactonokinase [Loktanella sp. IMCC34160]RYG92668.1 2-dehydro-3-deoxygalactonokinase [Loktanella sp. IMCC34160]